MFERRQTEVSLEAKQRDALKNDLEGYIDKIVEPREEYKTGREKLNFTHNFSTGEVFEAREDANGIASILLKKDNKILVDFGLLARESGYTLVTPSYVINNKRDKTQNFSAGEWLTSQPGSRRGKYISIGDIKSPQSIIILLHELGHADFSFSEKEIRSKLPDYSKNRKIAVTESIKERDAWANALYRAKQIKNEYGCNLLETFNDLDELKKLIYSALTYRRLGAEDTEQSEPALKRLWNSIVHKAGEKNLDFYRDFFDKGTSKFSPQDTSKFTRRKTEAIKINKIRKQLGQDRQVKSGN